MLLLDDLFLKNPSQLFLHIRALGGNDLEWVATPGPTLELVDGIWDRTGRQWSTGR